MPEYFDSEILAMIFDAILIVSVFGLWILWWRQARQRKHVEQLLVEASTQLQEATLMLDESLKLIEELKMQQSKGRLREAPEALHLKPYIKQQMRKRTDMPAQAEKKNESSANISQVAQMLCLQREGVKPEKIAKKLKMPLAQVKLMLMLQTPPNNSHA